MSNYNDKTASELRRKITADSIKAMAYAGIGIVSIALAYNLRKLNDAPEVIDIKADGFAKNDSIVAADFGTLARIVSVQKLDDIKYDSTVLAEGEASGIKYTLTGPFNVELTSGNDDATNTPIVRFYKGLPGTVTLVDKNNPQK